MAQNAVRLRRIDGTEDYGDHAQGLRRAFLAMCSRDMGADLVLAWPTAEIAVMGAEGAVNVLYRKEIDEAEDKAARRRELIDEYRAEFASPYQSAARMFVHDVIPAPAHPLSGIPGLRSLLGKRETRPPRNTETFRCGTCRDPRHDRHRILRLRPHRLRPCARHACPAVAGQCNDRAAVRVRHEAARRSSSGATAAGERPRHPASPHRSHRWRGGGTDRQSRTSRQDKGPGHVAPGWSSEGRSEHSASHGNRVRWDRAAPGPTHTDKHTTGTSAERRTDGRRTR